jgi:ActR/RegA family two-component response regulator
MRAWAATLAACLGWTARSARHGVTTPAVVAPAVAVVDVKEEENMGLVVVWILESTTWFS